MDDLFFSLGMVFSGVTFLLFAFAMLASMAIPYLILRLQDQGNDPELGMKIGMQFFLSLSVMVSLLGLTIMSVDLFTRDHDNKEPNREFGRPVFGMGANRPQGNKQDWFNAQQRSGSALVCSGIFLGMVHLFLGYNTTKKRNWPRVRRAFAGWRFSIHGIVLMLAVVGLFAQLFSEDALGPDGLRILKALAGVLIVWAPSWLVHLYLLKEHARSIPKSVEVIADEPLGPARPAG